jgi:hypothetical protein
MARKTTFENFCVEVIPEDPRGTLYISTKPEASTLEYKYRRACEEIVSEIKRHVDGISSANIVWDTVHSCEHCGAKWSEESTIYNGGCCAGDIANEAAELAEKSA